MSPSPTGSVRSVASSRSGTLSRPPPPPKPSHLSSAFTGTCNSIALRHYIQTHTTGGSFTTHSPSTATISRAHLGHGYDSSTVDHFVDAFDSSSEDEQEGTTQRPSVRGRTYTAPSVARVFDPSSDDAEAGDGTTRLVRNEPIAINGTGPSRVGNLRSMFEAAMPHTSTPLSRQNTGVTFQHTGTKTKPRISNQVRMLQAQITGDRFNGIAGAFNVADARSSVVMQTPRKDTLHGRDATDQSEDDSVYGTATQDLLGDALRMDAVVIPPNQNGNMVRASSSSSLPLAAAFTEEPTSVDSDATITRSASAKAGLTSSRIRTIAAHHGRDDSSATIRPSHSNQDAADPSIDSQNGTVRSPDAVSGTARRRSTRLVSGGTKGRLSSIFTASPQSSDRSPTAERKAASISPSPSSHSIASRSASEAEQEAERSRGPSMLIPDDDGDVSFSRTSHHLRANDGSYFDLDWRATSPTKASSVRGVLLGAGKAVREESGDSEGVAKSSDVDQVMQARPPSIVIDSKHGQEGASVPQADQLPTTDSTLAPTPTTSNLQTPRPPSARMPNSGIGKPARALYDFEGESAFNELIVRAGQPFEILNEQLAGGWSLGLVWDDNGVPTRGLIPQGWYCLIQDFTRSPPGSAAAEPSAVADVAAEESVSGGVSLPPPATGSPDRKSQVKSGAGSMEGSPVRSQSRAQAAEATKSSRTIEETTAESQSASETPEEITSDSKRSSDDATMVESESQPAISVSAFLDIGHEPAQWQQVEKVDAESATDTIEPPVADGPILASPSPAIDGMPAVSDYANPIDWSAVAASQSPAIEMVDLPSESVAPVQQAADDNAPAEYTESAATTASDWKGSIFGKKTFNRFASFVTSGAEDYVLSNADLDGDERSRIIARKVSGGGKPVVPALAEVAEEEDEGVTARQMSVQMSASEEGEYPHEVESLAGTDGTEVELSAADPNHHFVIAGPAGPKWKSKSAPFLVQVHHPEKRTKLNGMQEYTIYHVTSTYPLNDDPDSDTGNQGCIPYDPLGGPYPPGAQVTVLRRFTQFEWLHQVLAKHYSALLIPALPEKQYSGRFASDFIETRRADLEMWMSRLVRHPVLRYSEPIRFFVSCESEVEWRYYAAVLLRNGRISQDGSGQPTKVGVFANTWHPEFNFDSTEAEVEADRMEAFLKALEKTMNGVGGNNAGKQGVLAAYKGLREGNVATSSTYRDLSYTLLRTLTGAGAGPADADNGGIGAFGDPDTHRILGPPMGNIGRRSDTGATNEHGAWCWREDCQECLNLTSALQNTAECLQTVADLHESHARDTLLRQHERFKEVSRPHSAASALLETHRTTLARYREATEASDESLPPEEAEKLASRCETVINVTLSEMDRLHDERVEDFHALGRSLLDGEIELYESVLEQLKAARLHYDDEYYEREREFHVLPSRYAVELGRPKRPAGMLLMPSAAGGGVGGAGRGLRGILRAGGGGVTRPASDVYEATGGSLRDSTNTWGAVKAGDVGVGKRDEQREGAQMRGSSYFSAIWR